jgi:nitrogen fixation protein FixH
MSDAELAAKYPRAWLWPVGLTALLLGSVAICVITAVVATRDPSFALEPEYYQQAVEWDQSVAARRDSAALGWSAAAAVSAPGVPGQFRTLTVRLTDGAGRPVAADRVEVSAFHHARRGEAFSLAFGTGDRPPATGAGSVVAAEPGRWVWSLGPARAGVWQVRIDARSGADRFLATLDVTSPDGVR